VLSGVESLVLVDALLHLRRQDADGGGVIRPGSVGQDFSSELDIRVGDQLLALSGLLEVFLKFLTHLNVSEHLADFVHGVDSTLDFEFLEHLLLSFLREEGLIE